MFRESNLKLAPKKCEFLKNELIYLGHRISRKGLETDESKIKDVKHWLTPKCHNELKKIIGFCSYNRSFIKECAFIAEPMQKILRSNTFS